MTIHEGSCLCEGIKFKTTGPLRNVVACHCGQCRRWTGHFFASTRSAVSDLEITSGKELLTWFRSSPEARRGFCSRCGSSLFWQAITAENNPEEGIAILAGSLADSGDLKLEEHIYCADKGAYYEIDDGLPRSD